MMPVRRLNQFKKDYRIMQKRGKDMEKQDKVLVFLANGIELDKRYRDHKLIGNFKARRECHIEPDWLLIYRYEDEEVIFERTGTHSDMFK